MITELLPAGARWWAALGTVPVIALIWVIEAWQRDGFTHLRSFLRCGDDIPASRQT